jgi:outer membrane protein OmpU
MNMQDIGASYQFSPGWVVGGALSFYQMDDKRWTTLTGGVQYFFSRRTNVYANFASLRASGPNNNQAQLFTALASSSRSQFSTMVGIRHVF